MSAGSASYVGVRTVAGRCFFFAGPFFVLGCEDLSYVVYISHEWGEYWVLTLELLTLSLYNIQC
jgi:hypothetical protein